MTDVGSCNGVTALPHSAAAFGDTLTPWAISTSGFRSGEFVEGEAGFISEEIDNLVGPAERVRK